jgi:uncharacterized protein YxjI
MIILYGKSFWEAPVDISIRERRLSFASEYDVETPAGNYYARRAVFSFTDHLELKDSDGGVLATIEGKLSPLRNKHSFLLNDGRAFEFGCEKLWTQVYTCEGNGEIYRLYQHKGLSYSVFRDEGQIAAFTKNRVVWGKGNEYDLRMNHDAEVVVLICMVLTINTIEHDDDDSTVTIDFGSLGPEAKRVDETWQPT